MTAEEAVDGILRQGAQAYRRDLHLNYLINVATLPAAEPARSDAIRAELVAAFERARALAGHWTFDRSRIIALRQAMLAEGVSP